MRQLFQIQIISAKSACAETPWGTPWASASGSANLLGLLFTHPVYIQRPKDTRRIFCADMLLHSCPNVAKKLEDCYDLSYLSWSEFWPAKHHKTLQTNQTAKKYWNHMKSSSNLQYSSHLAPRLITSAGALKLRPGAAERPVFKVPESPMDPARWRTSLAEYTGSCYHSELLLEMIFKCNTFIYNKLLQCLCKWRCGALSRWGFSRNSDCSGPKYAMNCCILHKLPNFHC